MEPIFIWWIGEGTVDGAVMEHVRDHLAIAFARPILRHDAPSRPGGTWDAARRQHATAPILRWLGEAGPPGGRVLGVTDQDLFIPVLTYVFGEAQLGGRAAVVSTARLQDGVELLGPRLLAERLTKEAIHEVGHAMGLRHCDSPRCVMARSPGLPGIDAKTHELCPTCRRRLVEPPARREHVE
jgi:archaemetzincin